MHWWTSSVNVAHIRPHCCWVLPLDVYTALPLQSNNKSATDRSSVTDLTAALLTLNLISPNPQPETVQ